jgi:hypothetical protein
MNVAIPVQENKVAGSSKLPAKNGLSVRASKNQGVNRVGVYVSLGLAGLGAFLAVFGRIIFT